VKTDGSFDITVDFGDDASKDIVVEILVGDNEPGDDGNIKLAFDDLDSDATDVLIDYASTRKAELFEIVGDVALDVISRIDNLFAGQYIDLTETLTDPDDVEALVDYMVNVIDVCPPEGGDPDYNCIVGKLQDDIDALPVAQEVRDVLADLEIACEQEIGPAGPEDILVYLASECPEATAHAIDAIADDAVVSLAAIDTEKEAASLCKLMADLVAAWNAGGTNVKKWLAVKDAAVKVVFGDIRTDASVPDDVESVIALIRTKYDVKIGAAAAAGTDLITGTDLSSVISAYDIIRGMLIEVYVADGGAKSEDAAAAVESLLEVIAALGADSDAGTISGVIDG